MFYISEMNEQDAATICTWRYPEPASVYNTEDTEESRASFLDGLHFSVRLEEGTPLLGYIAFGPAATIAHPDFMHIYENEAYTDIALGLAPSACGLGLGTKVFQTALDLAGEFFPGDGFRVSVAADNRAALGIYRKMGFKTLHTLQAEIIYPDEYNVERTCRKDILVMVKSFC